MASSISILSLFVLVLINGYFTFPLDNFSSEPSPLLFENEFTTERSFNARATVGDDFFTTPSEGLTSSVTEPFSSEFTTITGDLKRSVDDGSDIFATTVEYEFTTDAERRERMTEDFPTVESSTFIDITEETPKKENIVEERTTERGEIVESSKRALELESPSEFTTFATKLFTSTSSDVAPELYIQTSTEFSPIELFTPHYVGSLRKGDDDEEHQGDRKQKPQEKEEDEERKPEKEQKRKPEKEGKRKPKVEEEEHETSVDSAKGKDSKKKVTKSDKKDSSESGEDSKEKYATGQLLDQDSSKSFQQQSQGFAILVETDSYFTSVTKESAEEPRFTSESTKLTQGEESTQAQ